MSHGRAVFERGRTSEAPRELELKLSIDPGDVQRLSGQLRGLSRGRQPVTGTLVSIYYDTPALALHKMGVSLRVRKVGRQYIQTLKVSEGRTAGTFDRAEWEQAIAGPRPDLSHIKSGMALKGVFRKRVTHALHPVLRTRVRRATYRLSQGGSQGRGISR
jgi:inorganic triphosphatase YgiF